MNNTETKPETWQQQMYRVLHERVDALGGIVSAMKNHLVKVNVMDSQLDVWTLSQRYAKVNHPKSWTCSASDLPDSVSKYMDEQGGYDPKGYYSATVAYPRHGGQVGGGGPNFSIILVPGNVGKSASLPIVEIEVGCDHNMHSTTLGRCYYKHACSKCDFSYTVDSSD